MREKGTIKFFNLERGFGFIERGGGASDVFLHAQKFRELESRFSVWQGSQVEFNVQATRRGPAAVDVTILAYTDGCGVNV
jgi:CspA family cold shock protein